MSIDIPTALVAEDVESHPNPSAEYEDCLKRLSFAHDETTKYFMLSAFAEFENEKLQAKVQSLQEDMDDLSEKHREMVQAITEYQQELGRLRYQLRGEQNKNLKMTRTIQEMTEEPSPTASSLSLPLKWKKQQTSSVSTTSTPTSTKSSRKRRFINALRDSADKLFSKLNMKAINF